MAENKSIEITPAMIKAGVEVYVSSLEREFELPQDSVLVRELFEAMWMARVAEKSAA